MGKSLNKNNLNLNSFFDKQLTTAGQSAFPNVASCDNWRYMARACYVPLSPPNNNEFTIVSVWDWQGGKCQGIGKLLTSEWFHGNSIVDVEGDASAFYNDDLPLLHQRCLTHTGSVICRPTIQGDGCGIGEKKVQVKNTIKITDPQFSHFS